MGLVGVIISSGAGCLSVALSLLAIRRNVRRRKFHNRKRTADLRLAKPTGTTANSANAAQIATFIKTSTTELVRKRRSAVVQTHCGKLTASSGSYGSPINSSHSIHKKTGKGYPLYVDEVIAANDVVQGQDQSTSMFCQDTTTSSPMKEFTVVGSSASAQDDYSTNNDFLTGDLVDDGNVSNDSCSETESCSFADDEFLSEEGLQSTEDERSSAAIENTFEFSQPFPRYAKKVSFQFANAVSEQGDLSNSRADHGNPVAENVLAIESLLQTEDVEIILGSDEVGDETSHNQSGSSARVLEVMDQRVLMGRSDALARIQAHNGEHSSEQGIVFHTGNRDKTPAKARKPLFVSVEPLAQMQALDEALNISPTSSSPEVKGCPKSWAVDTTEPDPNTKYCHKRDSTSAAQLQNENSQALYPCSENEKENVSGSQALSFGKLSRKARREDERPGMFRRSSYPALKRFRFSDRIKIRPHRNSGRNSK